MVSAETFEIDVIFIDTDKTVVKSINIAPKTLIKDAILLSGILEDCPKISLESNKVGMFGKLKTLDTPLQKSDRVEIYRPLKVDPKESRRRRAKLKQGS